jgi:hypothetical protein
MKRLILAVSLLAGLLLTSLIAREAADRERADAVMRMLCREIHDYRQRTGQLPPSLDAIADSKTAGGLRDLTNRASITYDPGSALLDRMPRMTVSAGRTFIAVQGSRFEYAP